MSLDPSLERRIVRNSSACSAVNAQRSLRKSYEPILETIFSCGEAILREKPKKGALSRVDGSAIRLCSDGSCFDDSRSALVRRN